MVETILDKVCTSYTTVLPTDRLVTLGIAKDSLLLNDQPLETTQQAVKDFARVLFDRGIGVLTLKPGITRDELHAFIGILGLKREQINSSGGIDAIWKQAGINALAILSIDYSLLHASSDTTGAVATESPAGLWQQLTQGLLGSAGDRDDRAEELFDPEVLAEMFNSSYQSEFEHAEITSEVTSFLQQETIRKVLHDGSLPVEKLAKFAGHLNQNLRRQFLNSSFSLTTGNNQPLAESLLSSLSGEKLLDTLEDVNQHQEQVSPLLMGLLNKLALHPGDVRRPEMTSCESEDTLQEKMRVILREHSSEEFVPDDYQQKLDMIIAEESLPRLKLADREELLETVTANQVESSISQIALHLLSVGCETPEERDALILNLGEQFRFSLQTGEYGQVLQQLQRLQDQTLPIAIRTSLLEDYCQKECVVEVIRGLSVWGKSRYGEIQQVIALMGDPCIDPLLDHLATEESLSLRRFLIDRLIEMGPSTRIPIINRLSDDRWFVLRNLIMILKAQHDSAVVPLLRPLASHSNQRVRQAAQEALLDLHDASAERQIGSDLDSSDPEVFASALHLAQKCSSPVIGRKLLNLLSRIGWSAEECDLKIAIIRSISERHLTEAIPELARILGSSSLFHAKQLHRIKLEIIAALANYPSHLVKPILERLSKEQNDYGEQAKKSLLLISAKGGMP